MVSRGLGKLSEASTVLRMPRWVLGVTCPLARAAPKPEPARSTVSCMGSSDPISMGVVSTYPCPLQINPTLMLILRSPPITAPLQQTGQAST